MNIKLLGTSGLIATMTLLAACATAPEEEVIAVVEETVEPELTALEIAEMELENTVGARVYFGYDQYNLTTDAQNILRSQAALMNRPENMDFRFRIAGNCDERGTREYNLALGERRAEAAKAFSTQSWGAIIAPFIIGLIADRFFNAERILGVLHLIGALLMYQMSQITSFEVFYPYVLGYMIAYMPTLALVNSISFHQMSDTAKEFSSIRVFGTVVKLDFILVCLNV